MPLNLRISSSVLPPRGPGFNYLVLVSTAPWGASAAGAKPVFMHALAESYVEACRVSCRLAREARERAVVAGHEVVSVVCMDCPTPEAAPCR